MCQLCKEVCFSLSFQFVSTHAVDFNRLSGVYTVDLIVGDAVVSNSFSWRVCNVKLKFSEQAVQPKKAEDPYKPKPEIKVSKRTTFYKREMSYKSVVNSFKIVC